GIRDRTVTGVQTCALPICFPLKFSGSTFEGTFSYSSNVPVSAMAIRGVSNERGDFLMSTLPVIDLSSPPQSGLVVVPHFADGGEIGRASCRERGGMYVRAV